MSAILDKLRQACHSQHEALHVHPFLAPLNQGNITLQHYQAIIAMFYATYAATEQIKPPSAFPDAPVATWLEADMTHHHIAKLNWTAPALDISSPAKLAGYLYVKQGSTLGGQFISKHLHAALGLAPGSDNHFFYGYGKDTGAHWRQFKDQLTDNSDFLAESDIVDSALAAFESIRLSANRMVDAT